MIETFHRAALEAGGRDDGAPGPRPDYGPHYFGAFVRDLDGNKLEAVLVALPPPAKRRTRSQKDEAERQEERPRRVPKKKSKGKPRRR